MTNLENVNPNPDNTEDDDEEEELTVGQLIKLLQNYPEDQPVTMMVIGPEPTDKEKEEMKKNNDEYEEGDHIMYYGITSLEEIENETEDGKKTKALALCYDFEEDDDDDDGGGGEEEPVDDGK